MPGTPRACRWSSSAACSWPATRSAGGPAGVGGPPTGGLAGVLGLGGALGLADPSVGSGGVGGLPGVGERAGDGLPTTALVGAGEAPADGTGCDEHAARSSARSTPKTAAERRSRGRDERGGKSITVHSVEMSIEPLTQPPATEASPAAREKGRRAAAPGFARRALTAAERRLEEELRVHHPQADTE